MRVVADILVTVIIVLVALAAVGATLAAAAFLSRPGVHWFVYVLLYAALLGLSPALCFFTGIRIHHTSLALLLVWGVPWAVIVAAIQTAVGYKVFWFAIWPLWIEFMVWRDMTAEDRRSLLADFRARTWDLRGAAEAAEREARQAHHANAPVVVLEIPRRLDEASDN